MSFVSDTKQTTEGLIIKFAQHTGAQLPGQATHRVQKLSQGVGVLNIEEAENTWKGQQSGFSLSMITSRSGDSFVKRLVNGRTPR